MKLASALSQRSDLQNRLQEMQTRLNNNAKVQEGMQPAEDPNELLAALDEDSARLETLIRQINKTNAMTIADGLSIADRLAARDVLAKKIAVLRNFLQAASQTTDRYSRSEILVHSTVNVPELRKQLDGLSRQLRVLDEKIQELNWLTDLMED